MTDLPDPTFNDRDMVVKQVGELAGVLTPDGVITYEFTLTEIVVDFECTGWNDDDPENGHYIGLSFDIVTYPELAEADFAEVYFDSWDFTVYDTDGEIADDDEGFSAGCAASQDELPFSIGPDESVSGWIVLDSSASSGSIAFTPYELDGGGWEWEF